MLVEELLQPLHELEVVLRSSLDQSFDINILHIGGRREYHFLNSVLQAGRLQDLIVLRIFVRILCHEVHSLNWDRVCLSKGNIKRTGKQHVHNLACNGSYAKTAM